VQTTLAALLRHKGNQVHQVAPSATVLDAVHRMNQERVGALLVSDDVQVLGIFTERDVLNRVVGQGRDPGTTLVGQVMTRELITVAAETTVEEAMAVVTDKRCRHLPVMDGGVLRGLVSIGDLTRWMTRHQTWHIEDLVRYITGAYPS
jgi:CBS domain-containing protein